MSNSVKLYDNLSAAQGSFSFPFSYLDANDIKAYVNGVLVFENNASTNTAVSGVTYTVAFQSDGATTLTFSPDVAAGNDVRIQRNTDLTTKAVDFEDGAVLTEASLDEAIDQVFFAAQEAIDKANDSITLDTDDKWDAESKVIKNVADPVNNNDAVNKQFISTNIPNINTVAGISTEVTTVAGIASTLTANLSDIQNAEEHAQEAKDYATKTNGEVQENGANTGNYSAKAWANDGTGVTSSAGAGSAKQWAIGGSSTPNATTVVDGTEYSAKGYAIGALNRGSAGAHSAKDWANYTGGSVDGTEYSAKYWAEAAEASVATFDDKYAGAKLDDAAADTYFTSNGRTKDAGDMYYSTSDGNVRIWSGTQWEDAVVDTTNFATAGFSIAMSIAL